MAELGAATAGGDETTALTAILAVVRERTGLDFAGYRMPTVRRRIQNRMSTLGLTSLAAYLDRMRGSDPEALLLVERLTIKVSRFYRNAPAFDLLREEVLSDLARRGPVRIWSAGCGNGEEAYTLAMLLEEAGIPGGVLATDVDPSALEGSDAATYGIDSTRELPRALAERYLVPAGGGRLRVGDGVRARVLLQRHDLTRGCPESAFDLVCCRNVLIYLQRELHARTLTAVRRAVRPGGYLFLGESEWPPAGLDLLPVDRRSRIFRVPEVRR